MQYAKAYGNIITDASGANWLDLQSGILNSPLGHDSHTVINALQNVITSGLINTYDRTSTNHHALLNLMAEYEPRFMWKPYNTGAEAIDRAIQIASTYFKRRITIAVLPNSFHGKLLSMSAAHYRHLPWGNPLDLIYISPNMNKNPHFDVLIYEPIQGWDGAVNDEDRLREMCDDRGALLIADEMITGFLRCGERFMNKTADIMVCGKGISQGVPLSFVGYKKELLPQGEIAVGWRTTGAGNNLAMTVGLTVLEELIKNESHYLESVNRIEQRLKSMDFSATGAFGFKYMHNFDKAKALFEARRVIGSWHCKPLLRVGPSFITSEDDLDILENLIEEAAQL